MAHENGKYEMMHAAFGYGLDAPGERSASYLIDNRSILSINRRVKLEEDV